MSSNWLEKIEPWEDFPDERRALHAKLADEEGLARVMYEVGGKKKCWDAANDHTQQYWLDRADAVKAWMMEGRDE